MTFFRVSVLSLALAAALPMTAVQAQNYPEQDIRVICGYAPGSGADIITRYFADKLKAYVGGKSVIVENKDGALTTIAAAGFKNAKPDGYTIMITAGNSTLASAPHLLKQLNYDPVKDFKMVTTLMKLPFMAGVDPSSPIKTLPELTEHLKKKGDKASYGYSSAFALASTELYQSKIGSTALGVSYKATPQIMPDLASGQLDFIFSDATFLLGQREQGKFRPLAVTFAKRSELAPDVPGMAEAGVPDYDLSAWWVVMVPAKTPDAVVAKLEGWFNQIVADPKTKPDLLRMGAEPLPGNTKMANEMVPAEVKKWGEVIKLAKIEAQ
jgi:tripartite-type tricarboxylate transporter receptor subunit TctC